MFYKLFVLIGISCGTLSVYAQTVWHLNKDKDGIKIYTGNPNSAGFKTIRTTAVLEGTLPKFISIFRDIAKQKEWVYATKKAYLIEKITDNELLYYVETVLPWPARNRDAVIRMKINENSQNNILTLTTVSESSSIPVTSDHVRVTHLLGTWEVKNLGNNKLSIDYFLDVDPGGSLPPWIVNLFTSKGPYETFQKLALLLKK